jgi:hypothetical protein
LGITESYKIGVGSNPTTEQNPLQTMPRLSRVLLFPEGNMIKEELLGVEIWIVKDSKEAKEVWKEHPDDRHRIWLQSEARKYLLSDPAQLQEVLNKKLAQPGVY